MRKTSQKDIERSRRWNEKNPGRRREISKRWYENNVEYRRDYELRKCYGISLEEKRKMEEDQGGRCAICLVESDKLCVDHDHQTMVVRGLLCQGCNLGIGKFKENPELLKKALEYLVKER